MSLPQLHIIFSRASVLFSLIVAGYGFWRYFRKEGITKEYWSVLAAAEVLYLAQAAIGVSMMVLGLSVARSVHILYGVVSIISIPGAFAFTRGADSRRETMLYALIGLFMAGVSIRAIMTATGL